MSELRGRKYAALGATSRAAARSVATENCGSMVSRSKTGWFRYSGPPQGGDRKMTSA